MNIKILLTCDIFMDDEFTFIMVLEIFFCINHQPINLFGVDKVTACLPSISMVEEFVEFFIWYDTLPLPFHLLEEIFI